MLVARPLSMQARVGRALQRYEGDVRLTCGVIPFFEGRVVLVSSQSSGRWILPKGGWELDEEANEAAAREAFEEAGVLGHIGTYVKSLVGMGLGVGLKSRLTRTRVHLNPETYTQTDHQKQRAARREVHEQGPARADDPLHHGRDGDALAVARVAAAPAGPL